jgi:hypothetical protein
VFTPLSIAWRASSWNFISLAANFFLLQPL